MSTRTLLVSKRWLVHKVDNFIAVCEQIVYKMWEPPWPVTGIALHSFYLTMLPVAQATYHELMGWIVSWKVDAGKRPWHNLRYYPICLPGESEGSHEISCQHSCSKMCSRRAAYHRSSILTIINNYYYYILF
jgi:hypothetical protein